MTKKKKVSILSPEFRNKMKRVGMNIRNDVDGMADRTLIALFGFTVLLLFWWGFIGKYMQAGYIAMWSQMYPGVPLNDSYLFNLLNIMDVVTGTFILIVWVFACIHVWILVNTEKTVPVKQSVSTPAKPKTKPKPNTKGKPKYCMYCNSTHIRESGKDHPSEMYCMSCRKYF